MKTFEREMSIRRHTTNLLQIFCEILLHYRVIFKSMNVADDISRGTLECEWVKIVRIFSFGTLGKDGLNCNLLKAIPRTLNNMF